MPAFATSATIPRMSLPVSIVAWPSRSAVRPGVRASGILAFALLTALGAFVRIPLPFTPVPVTLQTFFVLAAGIYLGSRDAALSQLGYLAIGAVGLPVFAGGGAGFGHFLGVTGGYLIAFPIAAALVGAALLRVSVALMAVPTAAALLLLTREVFVRRQDAR